MADDPDTGDGDSAEPLGDLAERIRQRRSGEPVRIGGEGDEPGSFDDLDQYFQSESFDEGATDELWEALEEEPDFTGGVEAAEEPDEHIVPKRSYCEDCKYFSEPPDVQCNHAGTTIVEYVDLDHIRVRNCPIVAERQARGERDEGGMTQMSFGSQGQD